jgi:hypothetical protein
MPANAPPPKIRLPRISKLLPGSMSEIPSPGVSMWLSLIHAPLGAKRSNTAMTIAGRVVSVATILLRSIRSRS